MKACCSARLSGVGVGPVCRPSNKIGLAGSPLTRSFLFFSTGPALTNRSQDVLITTKEMICISIWRRLNRLKGLMVCCMGLSCRRRSGDRHRVCSEHIIDVSLHEFDKARYLDQTFVSVKPATEFNSQYSVLRVEGNSTRGAGPGHRWFVRKEKLVIRTSIILNCKQWTMGSVTR